MRRPMALFGFTFLLCGLLFLLFGKEFAKYTVGVFVLLSLVFLFCYKRHPKDQRISSLLGMSIATLCAFSLLLTATAMTVIPLEKYDGTEKELTMTVIEQDSSYDTSSYYIVKAYGLYDQETKPLRLQLYTDRTTAYESGQILKGRVLLKEIPVSRQGENFSNGVYLTATPADETVLCEAGMEKGIPYYAKVARNHIKSTINSNLKGDAAALVSGICLGDTSDISPRIRKDFSVCGMGHLVAVSGLHTGTVGGFLVLFFLLLNIRKRYVKLLGIAFVWGFVLLVGAPFSAIRSGLMFTFLAIGHLIFRRADMVNTLGGAVLLILILYPFGVGDIGFSASVGSCLGIIVLSKPIYGLFPKPLRNNKFFDWTCQGLSVTLSVLTGILPCILLCFYDLPLIAPLANLVGVPLAGIIMMLGLGGAMISLIPPLQFISQLFLLVCGICSHFLLHICRFFGQFSFTDRPFISAWCLMAFCLCITGTGLCYRYKKHLKPYTKTAVTLLTAVVLIISTFIPVYGKDTHEILVVTNGYHTSLVVAGWEGTVVIGCDLPYQLQRVLTGRGIQKIDRLILPSVNSYDKNMINLTDYCSITQTHIGSQTLKRGLLTGLEEKIGILSLSRHITLGKIKVTANENFTRFTVEVQGQAFSYDHSSTQTTGAVITGALCATFDTTAVIQIKNRAIAFYQPRFLFG